VKRLPALVVLAAVVAAAATCAWAAAGGGGPEPGLFDRITFWANGLIGQMQDALAGSSVVGALLIFFAAGFLTSLTPCVYPIYPVVITFMGGTEKRSRAHTVVLAVTYVAGMAVVYTALGVLAGVLGRAFGTLTQAWWSYGLVGLILVVFGLSMLGLYNIQMPQTLTRAAGGGPRRGLGGALFMGAMSAVVAAPCAAPVVGSAMAWIGQQGRVGLGAAVMFAFSLGLGALLVIMGIFAGLATQARGGVWTDYVKKGFGVAMVALGLYFGYKGWRML